MTGSVNRLAARAIATYAGANAAVCRELLDMCGLIADDGTLKPDDTENYGALHDPGPAPGAKRAR